MKTGITGVEFHVVPNERREVAQGHQSDELTEALLGDVTVLLPWPSDVDRERFRNRCANRSLTLRRYGRKLHSSGRDEEGLLLWTTPIENGAPTT